jgi:hypothetical protein
MGKMLTHVFQPFHVAGPVRRLDDDAVLGRVEQLRRLRTQARTVLSDTDKQIAALLAEARCHGRRSEAVTRALAALEAE